MTGKTPSHEEHIATALSYDGVTTPRVVARGSGELATAIEQLAAHHNIPVIKDRSLLEMLASVPLGDDIPEQLYLAVATVLAYVWELEGRTPTGEKEVNG